MSATDAENLEASPAGLLSPQPLGIRLPRPSARSEPFWQGCRERRLVLPICGDCGFRALRAFAVCPHCNGKSLGWEESAGRGSLYSWTVVWRPPHPSFVVPYAPAIVALEEGWWFLSAVVGHPSDELREGLALQVEFHPASDEVLLPYFRPVP
ncbi:MAG TPA: OB-fold domain-containing protein [Acidimicrobiales bacterium]|nr:OB-fold domain-containing protein [Acidimicrobiales bacterium]